jgi:ABC-type amino acid transport substrate-binding protein
MKLNKKHLIFFYNILAIFYCSNVSSKQLSALKLSVAAPSSAPFVFLDGQGEPQGLLVDFLYLVNKQTGSDISITVMPWVRGVHEVKFGQFDALMPTLYTKDREEFISYPDEALIEFNTVLLKRRDDQSVINSVNEIGIKKVIAKKRAMSMGDVFDDAQRSGKINVKEVRDHEHAIQMLIHSRVDLVACFEYVSYHALNKLNLRDKIDVIKMPKSNFSTYLAFSKAYAQKHDINEIMQRINQVKLTPEYQVLIDKYLN